MLLGNSRKLFFMGPNETWRVSQLSYTETMPGSRDSRGIYVAKLTKCLRARWACEGSENRGDRGCMKTTLRLFSIFWASLKGDKTFIHSTCAYV